MTNLQNQLKLLRGIDFGQVDFTYHALKRMRNRKISFDEAQYAIENPEKIVPSLNQKNHYFVRLKDINILVALGDAIVVKTVWRYSVERVKSKAREKINKLKRKQKW